MIVPYLFCHLVFLLLILLTDCSSPLKQELLLISDFLYFKHISHLNILHLELNKPILDRMLCFCLSQATLFCSAFLL